MVRTLLRKQTTPKLNARQARRDAAVSAHGQRVDRTAGRQVRAAVYHNELAGNATRYQRKPLDSLGDVVGGWEAEDGMRERRVLISASGPAANVLKIRPPLVFSAKNVALFIETLATVLDDEAGG